MTKSAMTAKAVAPATPLPWYDLSLSWVQPTHGEVNTPQNNLAGDGKYALHAANAYPKLVEALEKVTRRLEHLLKRDGISAAPADIKEARALLRELGEGS